MKTVKKLREEGVGIQKKAIVGFSMVELWNFRERITERILVGLSFTFP